MPASSPAFGSPEEADDRLRSALAGPVKPSATASAKATEPLPAAAATSGPAGLSATAASSSKSWAQLARQAFLSPPESSEPSVSSSGTASPEHLPRVLRVNAGSEDVHADSHSEQTGLEVGDSTSDSLSVSADSTAASGGEIRPPVLHGIPGVLNLQHGEENKVDKPSTTASDTGSVISQADESLSSATLKEASTQPVGNVWKMRMQQQQQQSPSHSLKLEASSKVSQQTDGESGSFRPFNHTRRRPQYSGVRSGVHDQNGPSKEVQSEDLVDEDGFVRVQRKKPHASGAAKDGKPHYHNHYQGHTHGASSSVQQKPGRKEAEKVETKLQPTQVATGSGTDPDKTAAPTLDSGAIGDTPVPTSAEDRKVPIDTQKPVVPKKPSTPAAAKIVQVNARSENLLKESTTSRDAPAGILSGAWPSLDQSLNTSSAVPVSVAVQSSPAVASHTTAESTPQSRPNPHGRKSWKKLDVPIRYPPPPSVAARKEATLDRRRLSVEGSVKSVSSSTTSSRQDKTKLKVADVTEPAGSVSNASEGIGSVLEDDGNEAQTGVAQSEVSESITVPASDSNEPLITSDGQAAVPTKDNGRAHQRNHPRNNSNGHRVGGHSKPLPRGPRQQNAASQLMYGQQQLTPNPFPQAQIANGYPVLPGAGLQPPFGPVFHGFPPAMAPGLFPQGSAFMNPPRPSKPFASRGNLNNAPVPDVIVPPGETVPVPVSSVDLDTCVSWIRRQVEYYFSIENLCRDLHLRAQMSPVSGAVPLRVVAGFSRVRSLVAVARAKSEAAARAQSKQQQQQEQLQQQQAKDQTGETTPAKSAVESTTESMEAEQPVSTAAAPSKSSGAPLSAAPKTRGLDWAVGLIIDALAGSATVDVVELAADDWVRLGVHPPAKRERGVRLRENWETWILPAPTAVFPPGVQGPPPMPAATAYLPQFGAVTHQPPLHTQHVHPHAAAASAHPHHHHAHHAHAHHQHPHGAAMPYPMYLFPFPRPPHGAPIAPHPHGHHPYQHPAQQHQQHHQQQTYLSVPSQPPTPTAAAAALATTGSSPTVTQPQQQQQHAGRRRNNSQSGGQHHHHHGHHHHGHHHSHTQPGAKQQQQPLTQEPQQQQPASPAVQAEQVKGQKQQQQQQATPVAAVAGDNLA